MFDWTRVGYCTNVHSGATLEQVKRNLDLYAVEVKRLYLDDQPMHIGLWLCEEACRQLLQSGQVTQFGEWLSSRGFIPYTFNAFPFYDFHQPIVKYDVYRPTWADQARLDYTVAIAELQSQLLDVDTFGTISTLPLGWPDDPNKNFIAECANNLIACVSRLIRIKEETGRHIFLCIEPEPGCHFDTSEKLIRFFEEFLFNNKIIPLDVLKSHLGVCHDICHSAVMFEPQETALSAYRDAGIHVGKIQISSAIKALFDSPGGGANQATVEALKQFAEDRYLHQTCVANSDRSRITLLFDLPTALEEFGSDADGEWRIHFHLPIYLNSIGRLGTTNDEISDCLRFIDKDSQLPTHLEVETYAWNVLPKEHRIDSLAKGVAEELKFVRSLLESFKDSSIDQSSD